MLRPYRRKPPRREDSSIPRFPSASKYIYEQTVPHAAKHLDSFCGKIEDS